MKPNKITLPGEHIADALAQIKLARIKARIKNDKQFQNAIDEYVSQGITDPIEIAKLLGTRGCICAAVAVQKYLEFRQRN